MKYTITDLMRDLDFNYMIHKLGIEPAKKESEAERFNEWMRKMGNIHYQNHEAMIKGYEIVTAKNNYEK